jgi:hypothetical protein
MFRIFILFLSLPEPAPETRVQPLLLRNGDTVVVTATELRDGRPRIQIPPETVSLFFSLHENVQSVSGVHPASCLMDTGILSRA